MTLHPSRIPAALHPLIPVAEKWGISDDGYRGDLVEAASTHDLEALVHSIDDVTDSDLYGWLEGPESAAATPRPEYVAYTCLTMAIDLAKVVLKKRGRAR